MSSENLHDLTWYQNHSNDDNKLENSRLYMQHVCRNVDVKKRQFWSSSVPSSFSIVKIVYDYLYVGNSAPEQERGSVPTCTSEHGC